MILLVFADDERIWTMWKREKVGLRIDFALILFEFASKIMNSFIWGTFRFPEMGEVKEIWQLGSEMSLERE